MGGGHIGRALHRRLFHHREDGQKISGRRRNNDDGYSLPPQKRSSRPARATSIISPRGPRQSARTVMLLHGLSSNHTTWLNFMETLAARGIRSIAPDLRGHGFSDKSKHKAWYALSVFVGGHPPHRAPGTVAKIRPGGILIWRICRPCVRRSISRICSVASPS